MANDPVNPAHYAGRACADIGERLSANGYQILKYCWRLGKKDTAVIELGKAAWYADSERTLLIKLDDAFPGMHTVPLTQDLDDPAFFLEERIKDQPDFAHAIATSLWAGYNVRKLQNIIELIDAERARHARS